VQPQNTICHTIKDIEPAIKEVGYPVVIRPSNVLGGRAMEIIYDKKSLIKYIELNGRFILDGPILIDKFLDNAIEVDVDALCDGKDVFVAGIMQHIEEAGIHSGDSACCLPPYSLPQKIIDEIRAATVKLAKEIEVIGLMNVQYAIRDSKLYVIEVNPRASRTVPFVAKATGINIAKIASLIMVGQKLPGFRLEQLKNYSKNYFSVKEVVLPFSRFANVDTLLGPEMKSTGEVMGIDKSFEMAFLKAQLAAGNKINPDGNSNALFSIADHDKNPDLVIIVSQMQKNGFKIFATPGTAKFLSDNNIKNMQLINKEHLSGYNVIHLIKDKKIDLVINTSYGSDSAVKSFNLRRSALMNRVFYITTIAAAKCLAAAIKKFRQQKDFEVFCLQKL
jgi:carbamoyl-phosphate synthase large subunit